MEKAKSFRDLIVWQKAHAFVLEIYKMTEKLPASEKYGLVSQIRRSSVSIAANIVEGFRKRSKLDKARFYNISQASADETLYYLILINDLNFTQTADLQQKVNEVSKLLNSYCESLLR